jgi:anti-sigma B factor antagonist
MSLKARLRTDALGNVTVHMEGGLDYENGLPLRKELQEIVESHPAMAVTIDLNGLDFVGSSGIGHFVETIKLLNENKQRIKISNVKSEFLKVFKLYDLDLMSCLAEEFETDDTENLSQRFAGKKRTFQN